MTVAFNLDVFTCGFFAGVIFVAIIVAVYNAGRQDEAGRGERT